MRQFIRTRSAWIGNLAVILALSMALLSIAGDAVSAAPSPHSNPVVNVLGTISGGQSNVQIQFSISPVTPPTPTIWLNIFNTAPNGVQSSTGVVTVPAGNISAQSVGSNVYSVVYNVYLKVTGILSKVGSIFGPIPQTGGAVLYDVYLSQTTPPPNTGGGGGVTPPPSKNPNTITVGQNVQIGTLQTGTTTINGTSVPSVQVQLNTQQLSLAVSSLPSGTNSLVVQVPSSSVPTGGAAVVNLPSDGVTTLANSGKSLEVDTPNGNITLPPAALSQIASQLQPGQQAQIVVSQVPQSQLQQIQSSLPGNQSSTLQTAGTAVDVGVNITDSNGNTVGNYEPSSGTQVNLTLPYSSNVSGTDALKLGIYYYNPTTNQWDYVGGKTDLTTGTVTVGSGHLSTYAVLLDNQTFSDIQGYWAQSDIEIMLAHHVVTGESATVFDPTGPVTRAEFATMIVRALGLTVPSSPTAPFSDVPASSPYAGDIAAAVQAGIVYGYPGGTFEPNANITREEIAVMVSRAMKAANQPTNLLPPQIPTLLAPFTDAGQVASWAQQAMAADIEQHIINGETSTTLVPGATTTRAEATVMLRRLMAYLGTI